ncbi:hypothetical protein FK268_14660 [Tsukamurella sputi]|uniref:HD domain-containing protein n=1 Tax=Tsukamurella sputi TaxID=2591848 RepID=A0A5C5RKF7_9ACTN|nr:HD domain-containing protein [Tsukamurella sputi]TWS23519.1 hypothetical protein FK268_14660 [Tsukamurella sputi]
MPETEVCIEAARLARERLTPAVLEHSVRCYHWGRAFAAAAGTSIDAEEFFVACMLHDVHLGGAADPAAGCFAVLGADAARTLVYGPAAERIANAIERHFDPVADTEPLAIALHDAAHLDVAGYRLGELDREFVRAVCESAPRGEFSRVFLAAIREEARVRPRSIAAAMWWAGIALPVLLNPLDRSAGPRDALSTAM